VLAATALKVGAGSSAVADNCGVRWAVGVVMVISTSLGSSGVSTAPLFPFAEIACEGFMAGPEDVESKGTVLALGAMGGFTVGARFALATPVSRIYSCD
jgi:hypothetical protein